MKKKLLRLTLKKNKFYYFFFLILFIGCKDTFQRFSYDKFECKKNDYGIEKIWITKKQNNSRGQILINNKEFTLDLIDRTEINETFKIQGENLKLEIARATDTIKGIHKNKVFSINCIKNSFKM